ncbi:MAG TPA: penicillin-binding protein 2 [Pedococcus sp.]|nr:penicillin-binding protein 2 [Pedococcus sp.]
MTERSTLRLVVLGALLFSLVATLVGRLFFLQVINADAYRQQSSTNNVRNVITPAPRGLILDQAGRPLVANRTSLVVSLDRAEISSQKDHGKAVLTRLAKALGTTYQILDEKIQLCGTKGAVRGVCWNGSPFQPIPVAKDVTTNLALSIMERRASFPGVVAELEDLRDYPSLYGVNAAQTLGYLGAVSQEELDAQAQAVADGKLPAAQATLTASDLVGRGGLEQQYNSYLRGTDGVKELAVDVAANVTGTVSQTAPTPGDDVVTNIDARLQAVVEQQLKAAIDRARATQAKVGSGNYKADSGAAVVLDVTNGHVLAMASYPTYNPDVWVGGIKSAEYQALTAPSANSPLLSRATQGLFAPGSTFKIASTSAALMQGYSQTQNYQCPSSVTVGGRVFNNDEGHASGPITLARAIELSCDTVFYQIATNFWTGDGGLRAKPGTSDPIEAMARAYGLGKLTGIDLPGELPGQVGGRVFKQEFAAKYRADWCRNAVVGFPTLAKTDPARAAKLQAYAKDNCASGDLFQVGDAVNLAIGQGDTAITPLQLAQAYAALANGGTIYQPQVAKAIMTADGKVVRQFAPKKTGALPVSASAQAYLRAAFAGTSVAGTAAVDFTNFPLAAVGGIASKTGTAQVAGKQSTSWFATYAPANKPRYAVVMMVSQGGYGSTTSGPSVAKIYDAIFGVQGQTVDPTKSVLVGGAPQTKLPKISADGTPIYPGSTPTAQAGSAAPATTAGAGLVALPFFGALALLRRRRRRPAVRPVLYSGAPAPPRGRQP